jgi:hypothetical protein
VYEYFFTDGPEATDPSDGNMAFDFVLSMLSKKQISNKKTKIGTDSSSNSFRLLGSCKLDFFVKPLLNE